MPADDREFLEVASLEARKREHEQREANQNQNAPSECSGCGSIVQGSGPFCQSCEKAHNAGQF